MSGPQEQAAAGRVNAVQLAFWVALAAAAAALAAAFLLRSSWPLAGLSLLLALLWGWLQRRHKPWTASLGLGLFIFLAAAGILAGLDSLLMLACTTAALAAWDLDRFLLRLRQAPRDEHTPHLEAAHLRRLGWVLVVGLGVGAAALNLRLQLSLLPVAALALLIVFALGRVVRQRGE